MKQRRVRIIRDQLIVHHVYVTAFLTKDLAQPMPQTIRIVVVLYCVVLTAIKSCGKRPEVCFWFGEHHEQQIVECPLKRFL